MGKCRPEGVQVFVIFRRKARGALSKFSGRPGSIFGSILGGLLGAFSVHNFFNMKNKHFWRRPRRDAMEDRFRNRFWTIFERFAGMTNEQKCRRVCLFLSFGVSKMSLEFAG